MLCLLLAAELQLLCQAVPAVSWAWICCASLCVLACCQTAGNLAAGKCLHHSEQTATDRSDSELAYMTAASKLQVELSWLQVAGRFNQHSPLHNPLQIQ